MIVVQAADGNINGVAFSPDGALLAAACADGWLKVWRAAQVGAGEPLWGERFDGIGASHVQFSPDGKLLFASGNEGNVFAWCTATGPPGVALPSTRTRPRKANVLVCSRDGKFVAWAGGYRGDSNRIAVARVKPRKFHKSFGGHSDEIGMLVATPDGLMSGSADRKIRFWDWTTGRMCHELALRGFVRTLASSPDGAWLAGSCARSILLWPLDRTAPKGQPLPGKPRELCGHTKTVSCVEFSTDGATLASTGADGTLRLWDVTTAAARRAFAPGLGALHWIAFAPDGLTLAFSSLNGDIGLIDLDG